MRKILIRSGISPLDVYEADYMIDKNSIGGNVGNLIYAYSIYRALWTEDIEIVPDYYKINHNEADYINENYECYVIPLADAFRKTFVGELRGYTKLIKKLKIPVVVIGVGLSAPFEPELNEGFPFDEDVKRFVSAVLEKSNIIGVRGQITADYLTKLGFREGVDHEVIGCPSMYAFGRNLKIRETNITKDSMIAVNSSLLSPKKVLDFITKSMNEYPNYYFIPQWRKEMMLTYAGHTEIASKSEKIKSYPAKMSDPAYMNNRVRYFLNAPTWIDFMKEVDLSFGARLHGNITATIAGTPSLIIPKDARMRELAEYHKLTSLWWQDISENTKLEEVIQSVDFSSPEQPHAKNFEHFINFLNKNNLKHVYEDNFDLKEVPLDDKLEKITLLPPIEPISGIEFDELINRLEKFDKVRNNIKGRQISKIENKYKNKIKKQSEKIKHLEGTLNRKSVRLALNTANKLRIKK